MVTQVKYVGAAKTDVARSNQELKTRPKDCGSYIVTGASGGIRTVEVRMSLLRALVTSVFLCGFETWTTNAEMESA